jgi:hypothetical protein
MSHGVSLLSQSVQGARVKRIDARVDMGACHGLFLETYNLDASGLDDPEGVLPFVHAHGHGGRRCMSWRM